MVKAFETWSSYLLRRKFPGSLNFPGLWTNSYFYSTAGQVSADVIKRYIEDPHHGSISRRINSLLALPV
ncbi:transposase [Cylindrospermopsis raciborskii]|uniref:transposase n=1 Tax=Cylindrospermopsis raciborskii TaxID=77022 RepID=UPI0039BDCE84